MITAAQRRQFRALHRKRDRQEQGLFLVEGVTCVRELLEAGWAVECLAATAEWAPPVCGVPRIEVSPDELISLSAMESPNQVVAIVRIPAGLPPLPPAGLTLCMDGVQDPGNVGTILRLAAWFGVEQVVCSPGCADLYNPKVVQASMGALFRMRAAVVPLEPFLRGMPASTDIAGAFLDGENVYACAPAEPAVLVLGSESRGVSAEVAACVRRRITIPRLGHGESLNVAMAAAVLCSEWRRPRLSQLPAQSR